MEQYTRLNEQEMATVLQQFDIAPVTSFKLLDGGYENTNYFHKSLFLYRAWTQLLLLKIC